MLPIVSKESGKACFNAIMYLDLGGRTRGNHWWQLLLGVGERLLFW